MNVDYIGHLGDDLMVANAARVSFKKHHEAFDESDAKLLGYLAKHHHWTPFAHPQITLRIKAPVFVRAQLFKHKIGFTENEVSRRYVDDAPEFFMPDVWRGRPTGGAKQGSEGEITELSHPAEGIGSEDLWGDVDNKFHPTLHVEYYNYYCHQMYRWLLESGVAPEQARMVLPQSMYTEWYWTGSLAAYARMCQQRLDPHAQAETKYIATRCSNIIRNLFPVSWQVLV
jgi:thymidylate synthase (FAD)